MRTTKLYSFNTGTSVAGINGNVLVLGAVLEFPFGYVINMFLEGLPAILLIGVLYWRGFLKLAEWLVEVIPPKYFVHLIEWVRVGNALYVTNDSSPLPLSVPDRTLSGAVREGPRVAVPALNRVS
ncbi:hypothetical protein [Deinococcus multiflagellatus]|uniref:Uncharacterized protein n=1 Tax=Deinococcus multiflagellatus TaxID=1656887 RepID=A0ABW1ZP00_9DEIO|nr:hypothetical protein [Deinococcus multiflagellatus]MBZ9714972.1 hypothetical protein [Deinococcus multiflagellatus]